MPDPRTDELFAGVVAAPDDDAPRLVLADHLIAKGDPRGELISVQCSLARAPDPLLVELEAQLLAGSPMNELSAHCSKWVMHRGFLDEVRVHGARYTLGDLRYLLGHREIATVELLDINEVLVGEAGARELARAMAGPLARLRELLVARASLGDAGVSELLANPPSLASLSLVHNNLGDAGARTIAERAPASLVELDISYNRIGALGGAYIAVANRLAALETLWMISNPLGPQGMAVFVARLDLPRLKKLDISWCGLGSENAGVLSVANFEGVRDLDLRGNDIGDRGVRALSRGRIRDVERLCLGNNAITDDGIEVLCNAELPKLKTLLVENNPITDRSVALFREARFAKQLTSLGIWGEHQISLAGMDLYRREFPRSKP